MTKLTVIGCGYLGAVHAACMAQLGHDVVGIDVDAPKVALLASGRTPFFEPGFEEVLQEALASGRLSFTSDMLGAQGSQVHFVCVGTPQKRNEYAADMAYVDAAVTALAPYLSPGDLVVGKSTVPVGTARRLADLVDAHRARRAARLEPRIPPRGFRRRRTPCTRTGSSTACRPVTAGERAKRAARRGVRDAARRRSAAGGDRLRHRRTGQGRGQFLSGHQDLLHQCDGRGLRGQRRRCRAAGRRHRPRHPHRSSIPQRRTRLRRRLPAQGHPGLHGTSR